MWCVVYGVSCGYVGMWVCGAWCVVCGAWCVVRGAWCGYVVCILRDVRRQSLLLCFDDLAQVLDLGTTQAGKQRKESAV